MAIRATSSTSTTLPLGGLWRIDVETRDDDGYLADGAPVVVVTLPAGTITGPTFELVTTGHYRAAYTVATAGRYTAHVTTADDAVDFTVHVATTTTGAAMPDITDVNDYLGDHSYADEQLQDALDAEAAAQRARCRVRAVYPADLRQALLRRVMRNLAMRGQPFSILQGDGEGGGNSVLPTNDPEVRRLEAPHRKWTVG